MWPNSYPQDESKACVQFELDGVFLSRSLTRAAARRQNVRGDQSCARSQRSPPSKPERAAARRRPSLRVWSCLWHCDGSHTHRAVLPDCSLLVVRTHRSFTVGALHAAPPFGVTSEERNARSFFSVEKLLDAVQLSAPDALYIPLVIACEPSRHIHSQVGMQQAQ